MRERGTGWETENSGAPEDTRRTHTPRPPPPSREGRFLCLCLGADLRWHGAPPQINHNDLQRLQAMFVSPSPPSVLVLRDPVLMDRLLSAVVGASAAGADGEGEVRCLGGDLLDTMPPLPLHSK
jgi:hypothetical protein